MARRIQDPIQRIMNEYVALDTAGRTNLAAAIKGFELGSGATTPTVRRAASTTPRKVTSGNTGGTSVTPTA